MIKKRSIYLLGLVTLLIFPLPTFFGLYFIEGISPWEILQLDRLHVGELGLGIVVGLLYAWLSLALMTAPVFKSLPTRVEHVVKSMNLNLWDCIFLSICAGVGEELLFRSGVQFYLGPIITSVLFVAIHGYLNPLKWRMSLYGLIVLPFILLISYGYYEFGLWFSIGAHFSYDLLLFRIMTEKD
ncbi:MAG: CPBP family intramembrane metalloprotease [Crocinitomicaceae bacterium]|nr:CPBP family intramembrane metalloprotease [Crocinitomicaceae bacterium]